MGGILGIAAAVVEKEANMMCPKHLDQSLVLPAMLLDRAEFVAAGPEGRARGVLERGDCGLGFDACVDEIFGQGTDDAIAPGVNFADLLRITAGGLQDTAGRSVNHRGNTARLSVEGISAGHSQPPAASADRKSGKFSPYAEIGASFPGHCRIRLGTPGVCWAVSRSSLRVWAWACGKRSTICFACGAGLIPRPHSETGFCAAVPVVRIHFPPASSGESGELAIRN